MNDIKIFENEKFGKIRTAGTADNPYFCLADICKILGINNVTDVKNRLKKDGVDSIEVIDTLGRKQKACFINEQNLYKVIMRSDKPLAEPFQDWVCGDVLPTIRKTGTYGLPQTFGEALMLAAKQQLQIEEQQQTIEAHETEILALSDKISEMKPKTVYYDQILKSKNTVLVTQIAKDYGYSAYKFNQLLKTLHIQYKVREQWVLYAEYSDKGYTKSTSYPVDYHDGTYITKMRTEWTQKGRLFLYETLKANNILPLIEQ